VVLSLLYLVKARVDPCIFLHREPRDWVELLGRDFVEVLLERLSHVVNSVDELVDYIFSNPRVAHLVVRGLRIGGRVRDEWLLFAEGGYVHPGARAAWPYVKNDVVLDVRVQVSPCYLLTSLTSGDRRYVWRNRASALFKWVSDVPESRPWEVFREAFPRWLRELAWERGYAWVAWTRWRDRRNGHLAEWLYWLDTGRMPHIDFMMGRRAVCNSSGCTTVQAPRGFVQFGVSA